MAAAPLPGLSAGAVADLVRRAWLGRRGADALDVRAVSDAAAVPYATSGVQGMLGATTQVDVLGAAGRRFAWVGADRVVLDYTRSPAAPAGTAGTAAIGRDLAWAARRRPREIVAVLSSFAAIGDLGAGMVGSLSGRPLPRSWTPGLPLPSDMAGRIAAARRVLRPSHLTVFTGGPQRLLGPTGLARAWTRRGMAPALAQEMERALGEASAAMAAASADADAQTGGDLLGAEDLVRGPYAGAGGGAAFGLRIVGARVLPVREAVAVALEGWASQADLCLYVSGAVGESPPGGLDAAVACAARRAVPLVLVCDSASLQRSELARLGLNGVYEIRPGRAFDDAPETPATAAGMAGALTDAVARVAGTWGWE